MDTWENAQGKTNLIESIYFLAMSRSHRTSQREMLIMGIPHFSKVTGNIKNKLLQLIRNSFVIRWETA